MFGKKKDESSPGLNPEEKENEIKKIQDRLDDDERVDIVVKQGKNPLKPGGSLFTPNIVFATNKRLLIRNPTALGLRQKVEDYMYSDITNVRLEKGVFSSAIAITVPGMAANRGGDVASMLGKWGRDDAGTIDALGKDEAEKLLKHIRNCIVDAKNQANPNNSSGGSSIADELAKIAKLKEQGILSEEEFTKMKQDLISKM